MRRLATALLISCLLITIAQATGQRVDRCSSLADIRDSLSVTRATTVQPDPTWVPAEQSRHTPVPVTLPICRVEATIESSIGVEVWLPLPPHWDRRLLGNGVGGPAGVFNFADMGRRVNEGFVTFSTDSGHKENNARWMADAKAREDYTHRATHLATVAAKRLAERFYGEPPAYSYFLGCSGGGRQGLKEMQEYPLDFDGIVAGAPGPNMPLQSVRMMWFALEQQRNPGAALAEEDWDLYETTVTAQCDGQDGVVDGVIENPVACRFDVSVLACGAGEHDGCLTDKQVRMLERIIAPMVDEHGDAMDYGLVPGVRTRPGPPSPLLRALWADGVYDDPEWDEQTFERSRDLALVHETMPHMRADSTAIDAFIDAGGKAIIYQGWIDPSTVAGPTIAYYQALAAAHGGFTSLAKSVRLFMVPGMYHCRGGPGADQFGGAGQRSWPGDPERDILWAVIDWVEKGKPPARLTATRLDDDVAAGTHRLCPFPATAGLKDAGVAAGAASLTCSVDRSLADFPAQ